MDIIEAVKKRKSILFRTTFLSWMIVVFTVVIFVLFMIPYQRAQLLGEMVTRAKVTFTSIAQVTVTSILLEDYSTVVDHCTTVLKENPSILYVVITKRDGITRHDGLSLVHTKDKWSQEQLDGLWKPTKEILPKKGQFIWSDLVHQEVFHQTFHFAYSGIDWGWIHIGLSPEAFYADLKSLYFRTLWISLLSIAVGMAASYSFARRLSKPILILDQVTRRVGAGDLSARVEISTGDEVENLANSFNRMTQALLKSQKELESTHKKLVDTARNVGMAEVATGILHNVGNVLNSVGVTTASIKTRANDSRAHHISRITDQLIEHKDDLGTFITTQDRGKKLITFLQTLSEHITKEQVDLIKDIDTLTKHINHITEIVNLQQSYSKTVGMVESVSIIELIDDAIRINEDDLVRHSVEIKREFDHLPHVMLDSHKVLQILLNMVNNAKHALSASDQENRLLNARIFKTDDGYFRVEVSDNGVGISEENIARIFNYGFTTKKNGHGFGLHSGALNAKEMGGSINVYSEGPGKGATFTLELPFTPGPDQNG